MMYKKGSKNMMYPRFKAAIQFYRDSDDCYPIGECVELIPINEEARRNFIYKYKKTKEEMSMVPYIVGSGSHNSFRLKIGPSNVSSNQYASIAFHLPNGDGSINDKVSHTPKYNVSNREFNKIKFIAAGLVYFMGQELINYSLNQSMENSNALDEKLLEYSRLTADQQYNISVLGMGNKI